MMMAFQIKSVLSCSITFSPELWILRNPPSGYFHPLWIKYIHIFFYFLDMDVNNRKCLKAHGLRVLCCIFYGQGDSVRHGWYVFEWHFISAISLILMRFLSFIGACVRIGVCACLRWLRLSGKGAPIKQFVSDSEGLQPRGGGPSADLGLLTGLRRLMTLARLSH